VGLSEGGVELTYGLELGLAAFPPTTSNMVRFPTVPVSVQWTDESARAEHQNLAGDDRVSYQKIVAPKVSVSLDALSFEDRAKWRSLAITTSAFYFVRLLRTEKLLGLAAITFSESGAIKVRLPHSSYSLASKRSVAVGGASLLSGFLVHTIWGNAWQELGSTITVPSYDDATETLTLGGVGVPVAGVVVYINFAASAWLAKLAKGPQISPVVGAPSLHAGSVTFEGA
jgi:hypothetical protein